MVALYHAWESSARGDAPLAVFHRRETALLFQAGQVFVHRRMFGPNGEPFPFSWPARKLIVLLAPLARRVAARGVGLGFRPEHVETPDVLASTV